MTREELEQLADGWEAEATRLRRLYRPDEDYPHMNGIAAGMSLCADKLRDRAKRGV